MWIRSDLWIQLAIYRKDQGQGWAAHEFVISKIQTMGHSTGQMAQVLQQVNCKEIKRGIYRLEGITHFFWKIGKTELELSVRVHTWVIKRQYKLKEVISIHVGCSSSWRGWSLHRMRYPFGLGNKVLFPGLGDFLALKWSIQLYVGLVRFDVSLFHSTV